MNFDDVLFGLILCGIGLAGACLRSEYVLVREFRAAERRKEGVMRVALAQPIVSQSPRNVGVAAYGDPDRHREQEATCDQ